MNTIHIAKNIKYLRTLKGVDQTDIANMLGVKRTTISHYESGHTEPKADALLKMAEIFGVLVGDLIEKDLEAMSNNLTESVDGEQSIKDSIVATKRSYNKAISPTVTVGAKENKTPFFNIVVSAGEHGITEWGKEEPTGFFIDIPSFRAADAAFPVLGFSMEPEISNGDIVGVREMQKWDFVDTAGVYMLITDQERMIKRLKPDEEDDNMFWCLSNNYAPFRLLRTDIRRMFKVVACISVL